MSLRWKIWLSVFASVTLLFGVTGWVLQNHAIDSARRSVEEEVHAGFQAYEAAWEARQEMLGTAATLLGSLPNVRAAFGTQDLETIRDSALEVGALLPEELRNQAFFLVTDPRGNPLAPIAGHPPAGTWKVDRVTAPGSRQRSGYAVRDGALYQLVFRPILVDSATGPALISVLVAGYPVGNDLARRMAEATGSSDFVFSAGDRVFASAGPPASADEVRLERPLQGLDGQPVGTLTIVRTLGPALQQLGGLQRDLFAMWAGATAVSLVLSYLLARRVVQPIAALDRAAAAITLQNYDTRVPVTTGDEFGRLAATFNTMSDSIQSARQELIRQERISTVGRLASSIVHDLRNPLAAIYAGAEMLVDSELPPQQTRRLASNIYSASRRVLEMLQELLDAARGKTTDLETCALAEIVQAAVESQQAAAPHIRFAVDVPEALELPLDRTRMERVFVNLLANAIEVMPQGGEISIRAERPAGGALLVHVADQGPGIAREIRDQLFQPFTTFGKRNGLGLGLALSRQTVLDHGGDLTAANHAGGAVFTLRLPLIAVS